MKATPEASRAAFISKVPVGSSDIKIHEFIESAVTMEKHCNSSPAYPGYHCVFEEQENWSFTKGRYRVGFQFDIILDDQRQFKDVSFANYRKDL